jgi:hypothetical protein
LFGTKVSNLHHNQRHDATPTGEQVLCPATVASCGQISRSIGIQADSPAPGVTPVSVSRALAPRTVGDTKVSPAATALLDLQASARARELWNLTRGDDETRSRHRLPQASDERVDTARRDLVRLGARLSVCRPLAAPAPISTRNGSSWAARVMASRRRGSIHSHSAASGHDLHPTEKCIARSHHLLKTFYSEWQDRQEPDGTGIFGRHTPSRGAIALRGSDGEQTPLTRHTLEVMRAAILELDS